MRSTRPPLLCLSVTRIPSLSPSWGICGRQNDLESGLPVALTVSQLWGSRLSNEERRPLWWAYGLLLPPLIVLVSPRRQARPASLATRCPPAPSISSQLLVLLVTQIRPSVDSPPEAILGPAGFEVRGWTIYLSKLRGTGAITQTQTGKQAKSTKQSGTPPTFLITWLRWHRGGVTCRAPRHRYRSHSPGEPVPRRQALAVCDNAPPRPGLCCSLLMKTACPLISPAPGTYTHPHVSP